MNQQHIGPFNTSESRGFSTLDDISKEENPNLSLGVEGWTVTYSFDPHLRDRRIVVNVYDRTVYLLNENVEVAKSIIKSQYNLYS